MPLPIAPVICVCAQAKSWGGGGASVLKSTSPWTLTEKSGRPGLRFRSNSPSLSTKRVSQGGSRWVPPSTGAGV